MAKVTRYSDEFKSSSVDLYLKSGESVLKIRIKTMFNLILF